MTEQEHIKSLRDMINDILVPVMKEMIQNEIKTRFFVLRHDINREVAKFHLPEQK